MVKDRVMYQVNPREESFWEGHADSEQHALFLMLRGGDQDDGLSWDGEELHISEEYKRKFGDPRETHTVRIEPTWESVTLEILGYEDIVVDKDRGFRTTVLIDGTKGVVTIFPKHMTFFMEDVFSAETAIMKVLFQERLSRMFAKYRLSFEKRYRCENCGVSWTGAFRPDCDFVSGSSCVPEIDMEQFSGDRLVDLILLSARLIRWGSEATNAMSSEAGDSTRFESLFDQWDDIEARNGDLIRALLLG
jgi:hypothetical protein